MADEQPQIPVGSSSLADDEKALHKGRGRQVAVYTIALLALIVAGAWYVLTSSKGEEVRTTLGSVNKLNRDHYKAFWGCALQGPMERYTKAEELIIKLSTMATGSE